MLNRKITRKTTSRQIAKQSPIVLETKSTSQKEPLVEKIVVTSDWHGHLYNKAALDHLIAEHAANTDILVIGGDFTDGYSISSYLKGKRVDLLDEYRACSELLEILSFHFKRVVMFGGNHDFRWERQVVSQVPIEARAFIGEPLLKRLVKKDVYKDANWIPGDGYENVELILDDEGQIAWWWNYKSLLCAHSEKYLTGAGVVAEKTETFFRRKLGLSPQVVVCAHTHRLNIRYTPSCIYIEGGCMCVEGDYGKMHPALKYSEQRCGYTVVTMIDGKVSPSLTYLEAIEDLV